VLVAAVVRRTIVYIDGFNLYYGAIKGTAHKWLNLERLFQMVRNQDQIVKIKYFTALISGPKVANQQAYLRALATLPCVRIIEGKFKPKTTVCQVVPCTFIGNKKFSTFQEKTTDVNLALHMLDDAYQDCCDCFVLVSGDSDLVPALKMIKYRFSKKLLVVYVPSQNPHMGTSIELRSAADLERRLPVELLKHAQFPARIPDGSGGFIEKPHSW
jgi:6-hydroxy-3-succinoylpyridine 3-monooxygenase